MDNIIEIVVFVAILALSALGSAKKKKPVKQKANKEVDAGKEFTFEDIWKELTGEKYEHSQPDTFAPVIPIPSQHQTYAQPEQPKEREHVFSGMESSKEMDYLRKSPKPKKTIQEKLSDKSQKEQTSVAENEAANNELIKDFDIRKAILYSEIMTPKFKEY